MAVLLYMAGSILLIEAFQQVALIPLLLSGLMALWGWKQALPFVVPIGLMVLTLPFWDYLSWPLQLITVAINQFMLSWLDIEFVVEGVFVYFPGVGAFEIAHGCSGLRYLLVGVTLSLLYGELNLRTWKSRFWLVAASILFALVANWLRVFIIIYVGYESDMTSSLIKEHDFFGWWVFAATLVPLYFIGRGLEKKEDSIPAVPGEEAYASAALNTSKKGGLSVGQFVVTLPLLALVGVSWFAEPSNGVKNVSSQTSQHSVTLVSADEWLPLFDRRLSSWRPKVIRPDRVMESSFLKRGALNAEGGSDEELLVALYSYDFQRPGAEVVQYNNRLYDSSALLPERTFDVDAGKDMTLSGLTMRYRKSDELIHLAFGYYVEGRWERNELKAKLAQLPGILNKRTDASLLVIGLQCGGCNPRERLSEISPAIRSEAQDYLDELYKFEVE
jgi:exosortase